MIGYQIKLIREIDNLPLAKIIRTVLIEQGNNIEGTVFTDNATDNMYNGYQKDNSVYYVIFKNDKLVGGCGISQLQGENDTVCELQRLFLLKEARGYGLGQKLMDKCLTFAKSKNYKLIYLETFPNMTEAVGLYKKNGFKPINHVMGNTGHFSCTTRMTLTL